MIDKSDLIIFVISASLLTVGIYRWQTNLPQKATDPVQAKTQRVAPESNPTVVSAISSTNAATQTTISAVTSVQTSLPLNNQLPLNDQSKTRNIVVSTLEATPSPILSTSSVDNNQPLLGTYIVVSGDYLSKIAKRYGTTVETLQEINNLSGTMIDVGQQIFFPLPAN